MSDVSLDEQSDLAVIVCDCGSYSFNPRPDKDLLKKLDSQEIRDLRAWWHYAQDHYIPEYILLDKPWLTAPVPPGDHSARLVYLFKALDELTDSLAVPILSRHEQILARWDPVEA